MFDYIEPESLSELTGLLSEYGPDAAVMAGGTDLLNNIRSGKRAVKIVIGLRKVRELSGEISERDGGLFIGAMTALTDIAKNEKIRRDYRALSEAAGMVGSRQIRNRATLVGNVVNASPAADTVPPLLIFDARVHIRGKAGERSLSVDEFITGPGRTALGPAEVVTGIFIPKPADNTYSAYHKLSRRRGVDLGIVSAAAAVSGVNIRIALGAVAPKAFCVNSVDDIEEKLSPVTDIRASAEYRRAMATAYAQKALETARGRGVRIKE